MYIICLSKNKYKIPQISFVKMDNLKVKMLINFKVLKM